MKTYKVILSKRCCISNFIEFNMAFFKDDLSLNYGEKHFITELAEISVIILEEGVPKVFEEINYFIELVWNKIQDNKNSKRLSSIKQDAWRFFADRSPKGKIWYCEKMYYHEACYNKELNNSTQISQSEIDVEPINLEFNKWISLTQKEKLEYSEWFVLNPIGGFYPIINSPFHYNERLSL